MGWTSEEKRMLRSEMTNEEIARETGRSVKAVVSARYRHTGHQVQRSKWRDPYQTEIGIAKEKVSKIEKEARLLALCKQLGVRIGGMR